MKNDSKKIRFAYADGLRGLAALWVVFYHMSEGHHIDNIKNVIYAPVAHAVFDSGALGVQIFFVLSGFVMANNTIQYQVKGDFAYKFILRRLIRLTPPYYFAILFALMMLAVKQLTVSSQSLFPDSGTIVAHFLYAQGYLDLKNINPVFWTLCIELQFYIAFVLMVWLADCLTCQLNLRYARFWMASLSTLIALIWAFGFLKTPIWTGGFIGFWYSFMSGVLVCWTIFTKQIFEWFTLSYLLIISFSLFVTYSDALMVTAVTAASLYFAGIKGYMQHWLNWRWLQFVGLVSYSLYLLHNPLTGASANVLRRFLTPSLLTDVIILSVTISICLFVAWLAFIFIEKPSIRWSQVVKPSKLN